MEINEQDIIDSISRNEKKSRLRLLGLLIVCLALGGLVLWFAVDNRGKSDYIKAQNDTISQQKKLLKRINDELKDSLRLSDNLIKTQNTIEDVNKNTTNQNSQSVIIKERIGNDVFKKEFKVLIRDSSIISNPTASEIPTRKILREQKTIIYLQSNGETGNLMTQILRSRLTKKGYIVPQIENVEKTFNSIRYYFDDDLAIAQDIQNELINILQGAEIKTEKDYKPQKLKLNAKQRQIEVWVSF